MATGETDSFAEQRVAQLHQAHWGTVAANHVTPDTWWAEPCRAYNLHILPSAYAREALGHVQAELTSIEPGLLACPLDSLHVSVAWLLAVHADYGVPKDELWARHGGNWTSELTAIAAETGAFRLRYRWIVATNSAIIAVAAPASPVNRMRQQVRKRVELPPQTKNAADAVHTTLCRYRDTLTDPHGLLAAVDQARVDVSMDVTELVVAQERVYPSLDAVILARLPLDRAAVT